MPIRATAGQIQVNASLPAELRDYKRTLDKKGLDTLLREVAQRYPDKYVDISQALSDHGRFHAQRTGGYSFDLSHMKKSQVAEAIQAELKLKINKVLKTSNNPEDRRKKITELISEAQSRQVDAVFDEGVKAKNPLAMQILSGVRGSKANYNSLVGGDLGYNDNNDKMIPIPVYRTYSQGLSFPEYWASLFGARKGVVDVKLGVANAGYYSKLLNQVSHRNVVVDDDEPEQDDGMEERKRYLRGLAVDVKDRESVGALLARDTGPFKANTVITPKVLDALERVGSKKIVIRSPIARSSPDGGVYGFDVGLNENGEMVRRGDMPGMVAAQAVGEPVSQTSLNSKHTGGVAGSTLVSGFKAFEQLIQVPSTFQGGAAHAVADGKVQRIQKAPAGGYYVYVGSNRHYVPPEQKPDVKVGDLVEAGDTLSNGIPNPQKMTDYKGIGEGRRYWVDTMMDAAKSQGMKVNRRNLELISRGLINHVKLNDFVGDYLPDDVVPYHMVEAAYQAREGGQRLLPKKAVGKYLESPILHHTIGTRITPKLAKQMEELELDEVHVHDKPPPFTFQMQRASDNLLHDPDPYTKMYGSNLSKGLLASVHRGEVSDRTGTSFVPSLANAAQFGREGYFQHKNVKPLPLPPEGQPLMKSAEDTVSAVKRPTAVIVRGNPQHFPADGSADKFYKSISDHMTSLGYDTSEDAGEPFTVPNKADVWIGHSRGAGRADYAPKGVLTVPVGSHREGAINHPGDLSASGGKVTPEHFILTDEMREALTARLQKLQKTAGEYDIEPMENLSTIKPVKPPEMPWEKQPGQGMGGQQNKYSMPAPKNNMPAPGFSGGGGNRYQPMAGTSAQQAQQPEMELPSQMTQGWQPPQQYQAPSMAHYGVQPNWGAYQPQQQQGMPPDGFDYGYANSPFQGSQGTPVPAPAEPPPSPPTSPLMNTAGGIAAMAVPQAAVAKFAPKTPAAAPGLRGALHGVRGKMTSGLAGAAGSIAYDLATGQPISTGQALETTATGALAGLGGVASGTFAAPALIDAGKNILGMTSKEDIANKEQELFAADHANKTTQPGLQRGVNDALNIVGTAMTPVTSARAAMKAQDDLNKHIDSSQKSTQFTRNALNARNQKVLDNKTAPFTEEDMAKIYTNNRASADQELADFSTDIIKNGRPGDYSQIEKHVGEKMHQRADIRTQLQMSDSGQMKLPADEYARLQNQLVDLNKTIKSTQQELSNPRFFSASTLSKALLQDTKVDPNYSGDLHQAPDNLTIPQFQGYSRLKDMHSQRSKLQKQIDAAEGDYGKQQQLAAQRQSLDDKINDERKALKS